MKLFEPLNVKGMVLPNRIMVPAMVTRLSGEDGFVNEPITDRYVRYAQGGVGLIVVEAMAVHHAKSGPLLRISDDAFVPGLADLVRRIHDTSDSKVVPQIIHFLKVAKSGWRQTVDTLSLADIDQIVEEFGDAAARAREAGFDGAELHSAHAYTLASFVSRVNPRRDEYGGTLEGRLRLIGRVMDNIERKVGKDFPVGVRFLADEFIKDGFTVNDAKLIGLRLAELGAAYLSLSVGGKFEDAIHAPGQVPYPYTGYSGDRCMPGNWYPNVPHAHFSAEIKAYVKAHGYDTPVATTGKISDPDDAEALLAGGKVDIIGIARGLLADPDWPRKVRAGERDRAVRIVGLRPTSVSVGHEEFERVGRLVVIEHPHELDLVPDLGLRVLQDRVLVHARGLAPAGPEVDDDRPTGQVRGREPPAVEGLKVEGRHGLTDERRRDLARVAPQADEQDPGQGDGHQRDDEPAGASHRLRPPAAQARWQTRHR